MGPRLIVVLLSLMLAATPARAVAAPEPVRVALVVVNGEYRHPDAFEQLPNTTRDGALVAAALEHVGFRVRIVANANRAVLIEAVNTAAASVKGHPGAVLLVYYGGHAIAVDDRNYLVPPEASSGDRAMVEKEGVGTALIAAALRASGAQTALFFIDACQTQARRRGGWTPASQRPVAEAPDGDVHVVFSTMPDYSADDGPAGGHSPFAQAFAQEVATPDQPLPAFLQTLSARLETATESRQRVYTSGAVTNQPVFCFGGCGSATPNADELRQSDIGALKRFEAELDWIGVATAILRGVPSYSDAFDAYSSCGATPGTPEAKLHPPDMWQYCQFVRHKGMSPLFNDEGEIDPKEIPQPSPPGGRYPADLVLMLRTYAPPNLRSSQPLDQYAVASLVAYCQSAYPLLTRRQCERLVAQRLGDTARYDVYRFVPKRLTPSGAAILVDPLITRTGERRNGVHWHGREDRSKRDGCGVEVMPDRRIVLGCFVADRLQGIVRVIEPGRGWWIARYEDGRPTAKKVEAGPLLPVAAPVS